MTKADRNRAPFTVRTRFDDGIEMTVVVVPQARSGPDGDGTMRCPKCGEINAPDHTREIPPFGYVAFFVCGRFHTPAEEGENVCTQRYAVF